MWRTIGFVGVLRGYMNPVVREGRFIYIYPYFSYTWWPIRCRI